MEAENRRLYKLLTTDCTGILHAASCQEPAQIMSHLVSAAAQGGWHNLPVSNNTKYELQRRKLKPRKAYRIKLTGTDMSR